FISHYLLERYEPRLEDPFHIATIPIVIIFMALIGYHENLMYRWGSELDRARMKMNELMSDAVAKKRWEPVLTESSLPSCWQELDCDRKSCPAYGIEHIRCWLVAGTFCRGKAQGKFAAKLEDCRECEVYKSATSDPVQEITENFYTMNFMLSERERQLTEAYEETRDRSEKLAGLVGLSEAALSSMHATELLQNLLESTASFMGADIGVVYMADQNGEKLVSRVTYGLEPGVADKLTVRASDGIIGQAYIGRYIAVSENVADDRRITNQYLKSLGVRTLINLPLQGMKKMLGILTLGTLTPHHYSEEERDSLYVAADRVAAALESSELASRLGKDQGQLELMAAVSKDPGSMDS
ncbi:MAG: GAF domain-containing protein, partial [Actinomycetota bacterium]